MLSLATENDRDWQESNIVKRAGIHEAANLFWKKKKHEEAKWWDRTTKSQRGVRANHLESSDVQANLSATSLTVVPLHQVVFKYALN